MSISARQFASGYREDINESLAANLPLSPCRGSERFNEALRQAVFPGGKRVRPLLTLAGALLAGGKARDAMPVAAAIEFLHTSSILLDDLPSMDDGKIRRGRPALHLRYGEALTTLVSLALLNQAYALMARASGGSARLTIETTRSIGVDGMIGGQVADLELGGDAGRAALASRGLKTSALMALTLGAGAISCGAPETAVRALAAFGERLGVAYQIRDDLLDALEPEATGKTNNQDRRNNRLSYVGELGVLGARLLARRETEEAIAIVHGEFGAAGVAGVLLEIAETILRDVTRDGIVPCRVENLQPSDRETLSPGARRWR